MFSKSRIHEPAPKASEPEKAANLEKVVDSEKVKVMDKAADSTVTKSPAEFTPQPKVKHGPTILSADLTIMTGDIKTSGDIQIGGTVHGNIRAHLLTVEETAVIQGEIIADDVIINGKVIGRICGLKVRLASTARVEGDIIHKTIAIESGAQFEGTVQRQEDPLGGSKAALRIPVDTSASIQRLDPTVATGKPA